eukprot:11634443-Karenia_brevis.AAC.1
MARHRGVFREELKDIIVTMVKMHRTLLDSRSPNFSESVSEIEDHVCFICGHSSVPITPSSSDDVGIHDRLKPTHCGLCGCTAHETCAAALVGESNKIRRADNNADPLHTQLLGMLHESLELQRPAPFIIIIFVIIAIITTTIMVVVI